MRFFRVVFVCLLVLSVPDNSLASGPDPAPQARPGPKNPRFWVVNFGTATTLAPGKIGFAAGIGGQLVLVGDPQTTSAFFTIPHAGFRFGLAKNLDAGLRLAPIPLPYSTVGPGFGINADVKYCLTKPEDKVQFGVVVGAGGAHVLIENKTRWAYSPNLAALTTFSLNEKTQLTTMGRYVFLGIPTAPGGRSENFVNISGISFGIKKNLSPAVSLFPEVGAYWYQGKIAGVKANGPGFQYGIMLATSF